MSKVVNNCHEITAIELLASGKTSQEVADTLPVDVARSTIDNLKHRNQEAIKKAAQQYLNAMPSIVENDLKEIAAHIDLTEELIQSLKEESQIIETKDGKSVELFPAQRIAAIQKFREQIDKKITDIKRSIGILPAHTQGLIFQQFNLISSQTNVISDKVLELLGNQLNSITDLDDSDVIEAELAST